MSENERTRLEKRLAVNTTRYQAKAAQLAGTRAELDAINEELSTEANNNKWEVLADKHGRLNIRMAALIDEGAVLNNKIRIGRLDINDYDLAQVHTEIAGLITEQQENRARIGVLQNEFRVLVAKPTSDMDAKQKVLDIKMQLEQFAMAGELANRQHEAAKRRRDALTESRAALAA